jgi:hypothetical protein
VPHLEGVPALVFAAVDGSDEWNDVRSVLGEAFESTRDSARRSEPIVYVVMNDDLLGRRGPGRAMVATGLLSAARTTAVELAKAGVPVNVLAIESDTAPEAIAHWVRSLVAGGGPSGELIHLGTGHIGKALA